MTTRDYRILLQQLNQIKIMFSQLTQETTKVNQLIQIVGNNIAAFEQTINTFNRQSKKQEE